MQAPLLNIQLTEAFYLAGEILAFLVTLATIITALTPSQSDNQLLDKVLSLLNLFAGNVGFNRNADEK